MMAQCARSSVRGRAVKEADEVIKLHVEGL
jgi:hypothetical protein